MVKFKMPTQATAIKWGAIVLLAAGALFMAYREGVNKGKVKCEQERAEDAAFVIDAMKEEIQRENDKLAGRLETAYKDTEEGSRVRSELKQLRGTLSELLAKRTDNPSCAPTPDELRLYEEIARKTRSP